MNKSFASNKTNSKLLDKAHGERLQKVMARAGVASRRDCEKLIEDGMVKVNDKYVTKLPVWADITKDKIEVSGRIISLSKKKSTKATSNKKFTYIMLNKPKRTISTTNDEKGRNTVIDLVDLPGNVRLFPVGRLDSESTGLVLLTDDGEIANKITHPRYEITKQYHVVVDGKITQDDLQKLRDGLFLVKKDNKRKQVGAAPHYRPEACPTGKRSGLVRNPTKRAAVESVAITGFDKDRTRGNQTHLKLTLKEGRNREIRRLLARIGYKVRRLQRTSIGPLKLKGIALGQWRKLTGKEIIALRKATKNG